MGTAELINLGRLSLVLTYVNLSFEYNLENKIVK